MSLTASKKKTYRKYNMTTVVARTLKIKGITTSETLVASYISEDRRIWEDWTKGRNILSGCYRYLRRPDLKEQSILAEIQFVVDISALVCCMSADK